MSTSPEKNENGKAERKKKPSAHKKIKVDPKLALVQDALLLMEEGQVSELHYEQGGVKIHLRKGAGMPFEAVTAPVVAPTVVVPASATPTVAASAPAATPQVENGVTLNSPMVGTFYRSPSPDAKPFAEEGGRIEAGQVYCIIEAMKLMNEVKAEVSGKVTKILVQNGQAVEFNQPLIVIDPS